MLLSYYFHKIERSAINGGMNFFIDNHILKGETEEFAII